MNKKVIIVLSVAFVAATAATIFFYMLVSRNLGSSVAEAPTDQIVVAARDLPRGAEVQADDLRQAWWDSGNLPEGSFRDPSELVGRHVIRDVYQGEPVIEPKLTQDGLTGWSAQIPSGMRAVSVHVREYAGVTQLLEAGDHVDVLLADGPPSAGDRTLHLKTILQDVEVLATGREPQENGQVNEAAVVTLLVDAEDSETLTLADHSGSIRLTLRNPLDDGTAPARGGFLSDLLEDRDPRKASSAQRGSWHRNLPPRNTAEKAKEDPGEDDAEISGENTGAVADGPEDENGGVASLADE